MPTFRSKNLIRPMSWRSEPAISRDVRRAFAVPDATVQPWILLNLMAAKDIRRKGGEILLRHRVTGIDTTGGSVHAVEVEGPAGSLSLGSRCRGQRRRSLVGGDCPPVGTGCRALELTKGSILVFAHR